MSASVSSDRLVAIGSAGSNMNPDEVERGWADFLFLQVSRIAPSSPAASKSMVKEQYSTNVGVATKCETYLLMRNRFRRQIRVALSCVRRERTRNKGEKDLQCQRPVHCVNLRREKVRLRRRSEKWRAQRRSTCDATYVFRVVESMRFRARIVLSGHCDHQRS
jgi:hypothetical protein